jgi:hypothetical protein
MNFTTRLHETAQAGWLAKQAKFSPARVFGHTEKDNILLKSRASSGKRVYMENNLAWLPEVPGHKKWDLG